MTISEFFNKIKDMSKINFGLIGAAGYIAPRHIKAIADTSR